MSVLATPLRRLLCAASGALLALSSLSAHADLQSTVTVSLIAPGGTSDLGPAPISLQQTVAPADFATGISTGDGSPIGGMMLAGEEIYFVGNTIRVSAYGGGSNQQGQSITGYFGAGGQHARYVFDGLSIAGFTIVGARNRLAEAAIHRANEVARLAVDLPPSGEAGLPDAAVAADGSASAAQPSNNDFSS